MGNRREEWKRHSLQSKLPPIGDRINFMILPICDTAKMQVVDHTAVVMESLPRGIDHIRRAFFLL